MAILCFFGFRVSDFGFDENHCYTPSMILFFQKLSEWLFYALGISFFVAYLLYRNTVASPWPEIWLSILDLPLLLSGILYGGISLYLSIKNPDKKSKILALSILIPLVALFTLFLVMNFWEVF